MHPAADDNLLIDARNTWAAYKVHRRTGAVIWTLGGKSSSFALRAASGQTLDNARELFACQHDPQQTGPDQYTFFDNEAAGTAQLPYSRAIVVRLDKRARTATLVRSYSQPGALSASPAPAFSVADPTGATAANSSGPLLAALPLMPAGLSVARPRSLTSYSKGNAMTDTILSPTRLRDQARRQHRGADLRPRHRWRAER